jgi:2-succinyl-6-hydroxy-2,4-cyclohexadiene-1-carboxylate synthase
VTLHCERDHPTTTFDHAGRVTAKHPARIVLVHGFAQTSRCWGAVTEDLAKDHELVRVDAPGHGGSADIHADLPTGARLLAEAGGPATYLGYSMGARLALHVALRHPEVVSRLVLVGGTPGIEDDGERSARRRRDRDTAARIRAEGVDAFLASWFDQPLFATLPPEAQFLDERRRNTAEGLACSLELAGTGAQESLWTDLPQLGMPVLTVAGGRDERYAAIARRMADEIGENASSLVVDDAGHAAHLEAPERFLGDLRRWLRTPGT